MIESGETQHYTMAEAEDIVPALVDHVAAQLVMALSCFLGLQPDEIAALDWSDFDKDNVHIRKSVVRGIIGTPKTAESTASLPLIDQVRVPFELWRNRTMKESGLTTVRGLVFPSRNNTPTICTT